MLSQLRAVFSRNLRDMRLYLFLAATFFLFFFFWGLIPIRSLGWLQRNIRDFSFPYVASIIRWEDISSDPENVAAALRFYVSSALPRILAGPWPLVLLSIYSSAVLVGTQFTGGAVQDALEQGHTRGQIFLSSLVFYTVTILMALLLSLFGFLFLKFGTAWIPLYPPAYLLRCVGTWLWSALGFLSLTFAAAYVMKNVFGTMLVSAGLFAAEIVVILIARAVYLPPVITIHEIGQTVTGCLPFWLMNQPSLWQPDTVLSARENLLLFLIPLAYILCSLIVAWLAFRQRELS